MSNYDFQVFTQLVPSGATISELRKQVQDYFDKNAIKVKFSNFDLSGAASGTTTKQINATANALQAIKLSLQEINTARNKIVKAGTENTSNQIQAYNKQIKDSVVSLKELINTYAKLNGGKNVEFRDLTPLLNPTDIQAATDALRSLLQGAGMNGAVVETALASFKKGCWEVSEAAAKAADAVQKMHSEMAAKASAATAKTGQSVYAKYSDISAPDIANYTVDTTKLVQSYQAVKQQITDIQTVQSSGAKVSQAQWQLLIDAAQQYEIALKNVKVEQKDATVTQKKADKELADLDKLQNKLTQLQATFGEGYFNNQKTIIQRLGLSSADVTDATNALATLRAADAQLEVAISSNNAADKQAAITNLQTAYQGFGASLRNLQTAARELNSSLNSGIQFQRLKSQAQAYFDQYATGIQRNSQLTKEWRALIQKIGDADQWQNSNQAAIALDDLKRRSQAAGVEVTSLNKKLRDMFGDTLYGFAVAQITSVAANAIHQVVTNVVELDKAMTDLQIASGLNRTQVRGLMEDYGQLAQAIGATTLEVAEAADGWLRQGYSMQETSELIKSSMMLSKLGQMNSDDATKALTSSLKGYQLQASSATDVVSKLVAVDMEAAASAGGLATAMSQTATLADQTGISMDRLIGIVATLMDVSQQSGESVGTAVKSMLARLGNIKAGRLIDPETGESLSDVETVLNNIGVKLRTNATDWRDYQDVLDDVAAKWGGLNETQQRAVAVALGQTRRQEQLNILMANYDKVRQFTETAANATGTAERKYLNYMDSVEAKINTLKASWESLSQTVLSSDLIVGGVQFLSKLIQGLDKVDSKLGAVPSVLAAISLVVSKRGKGLFGQEGLLTASLNKNGSSGNFLAQHVQHNFLTNKDISLLHQYNEALSQSIADGNTLADAHTKLKAELTKGSAAFQQYAVQLDGTGDSVEKVTAKGLKLSDVLLNVGNMALNMALSATISMAIGLIIKWIDQYIRRIELAQQKTQEAIGVWQGANDKLEEQRTKLGDTSDRLEELNKLKAGGDWTEQLEAEKRELELQNGQIRDQIELLKTKAELDRQAAVQALKDEIATTQGATQYAFAWKVAPSADAKGYAVSGLAADSGQRQYVTADQNEALEIALARLHEIEASKKESGKLTKQEQADLESIRTTLTDVGLQSNTWATQLTTLGEVDLARPYLDVVSAASDAVELANRIQADTTVLSDTLKQALDSNANLAALAGGLTKTQLLARQNSGAYQALATIAAQYGKTVEDITPILEDLGYLQKEVAGSTEDLKDEQGQLNDIWAAARSAGDDASDTVKNLKAAIGTVQDWRSTKNEVAAAIATINQLTGLNLDVDADGLLDTLDFISAYLSGDIEKFEKYGIAAIKALGVKPDASGLQAALQALITQFGLLSGAAQATAATILSAFESIGAIKWGGLTDSQQAIMDDPNADPRAKAYIAAQRKRVVNDDWFKSTAATSKRYGSSKSGSSKKTTDSKLEAYKAYINELDHLLAMEQITEQEYYKRSLDAFNKYLGDKKKYQDQWWALQEKYYKWWKKQAEDAARDRYEADKKAAEDAYKAEKERIDKLKDANDDLLSAYQDRVNFQKKQLNRAGDERSYDQEVAAANKRIADLKAQIEVLSLDDSANAKAKRLELQEQLDDELLDLDNKMYDRSADVQSDALDDSLDEYSRYIGAQNKLLDEQLRRLEKQHNAILDNLQSTLDSALNNISTMFQQMIAETENMVNQINAMLASIDVSSRAGISQMQQALVDTGYNIGSYGAQKNGVDGVIGKMTVKGLQQFLNDSMGAGLKVDGKVGSKTYAAIQNAVNAGLLNESYLKAFPRKYHTGGVVGQDFNSETAFKELVKKKPDEVDARLRKGEVVLTEDQAIKAAKRLAFSSSDAERLFTIMSQGIGGLFGGDGALKQATKLAQTVANNTTHSPSVSVINNFNGTTDADTVRAIERWSETFKKQIKEEIFRVPINSLARTGRL